MAEFKKVASDLVVQYGAFVNYGITHRKDLSHAIHFDIKLQNILVFHSEPEDEEEIKAVLIDFPYPRRGVHWTKGWNKDNQRTNDPDKDRERTNEKAVEKNLQIYKDRWNGSSSESSWKKTWHDFVDKFDTFAFGKVIQYLADFVKGATPELIDEVMTPWHEQISHITAQINRTEDPYIGTTIEEDPYIDTTIKTLTDAWPKDAVALNKLIQTGCNDGDGTIKHGYKYINESHPWICLGQKAKTAEKAKKAEEVVSTANTATCSPATSAAYPLRKRSFQTPLGSDGNPTKEPKKNPCTELFHGGGPQEKGNIMRREILRLERHMGERLTYARRMYNSVYTKNSFGAPC